MSKLDLFENGTSTSPEYPIQRPYMPMVDAGRPAGEYLVQLGNGRISLRDFDVRLRIAEIAPAARGVEITVHMQTTDRETNAEPIEIDFRQAYPHVRTKSELVSAVRDLVMLALKHEIDEKLFCDGTRIRDPHRDDPRAPR